MICPKCGANIDDNAAFCPNCGALCSFFGEGADGTVPKVKLRTIKDYDPTIFTILWFVAGGMFLGTNDFYAGFIKMGLFRLISTIGGFILGIATMSLGFLFFPGISFAIGFWELTSCWNAHSYRLENGDSVPLSVLDMTYDREGVNNLMIKTHGAGIVGRCGKF